MLDWGLLRRILGLAQPFKRQFVASTALALILACVTPIRPILIQRTIDSYILQFDLQGLIFMTMVMIGLLVLESLLQYGFGFITSWLGQMVIKNLRTRVFNHVVSLRLRFFDRTPIGTITTRTINDVETINNIFSEGLIQIIADLMTIIAIIAVMLWYSWQLTLVSLATFPLLIYATYLFKEGVKSSFQDVRNQVARLNAFLQEHITGMRVIQIFNAERTEMDKFMAINAQHRDANIRSIWYYSVFFPVVEVILASAIGLGVWYGSTLIIRNPSITQGVTIGTLTSFIVFLNMLFRPLRMLADKFNTLQMGMVAAERVFTLLDNQDTVESSGSFKPAKMRGQVDFEQVWFAYEGENYVLKDVSFNLEEGKTLAIVGATGAGKSSIINILNRFYEIQKGSIKVDGTDIRQYELNALRAGISLVLQDVFLFSGSILENITLRDATISRDEVIKAAKMVGAHDFIMRLPGGYDYNVMERGATLSMGQRQLISFIRALVFDPSILILDEATSSIDTESELMIQNAIEQLVKGRTSIVIAHRLSTIQSADAIMVLDKGEIKEIGTHDELLQIDGYYKRLYEMQFKKQIAI
ncbi:MAG: ABC transporter ATP-binding protein [Chitinophagales bacterium]|nr:ABC transporter ATP-binding protein [Chitinophagales bacterium]